MATSPRNLVAALASLSEADQQLSIQNYKIDHVVTGGSATTDGATGIFLDISGDSTPGASGTTVQQAPYLDSLTSPVKGQMVRVLIVNSSPIILGRVIGLPAL